MDELNESNEGRYHLSPSNLTLNVYDDDAATSQYVSDDYVQSEVVKTGNCGDAVVDKAGNYEDMVADQANPKSINDSGYYDSPFAENFADANREENNVEVQKPVEREKLIPESLHSQSNNWPWFYPLLYHNIEADIPQEYQVYTRTMYHLFLATCGTMFWNWIVICVVFFGGYGSGIMDFIWSTVYVFPGCPLAWKTWYKSLYKSLKGNGSSFRWMLFMISYIVHTAYVTLAALGIPGFASSGFIFMVQAFGDSMVAGFFALVGFFFWALLSFFSITLFKKSWRLFRSSDVEKDVKKELVSTMVTQIK